MARTALIACVYVVQSNLNPVCIGLSEIVQIPKASSYRDEWNCDFLENYHSLLLKGFFWAARATTLFLVFTQLGGRDQGTSAPKSGAFSA